MEASPEKTDEQVSSVTSAAVILAQARTRDGNFHIVILVHTYPNFSCLNSAGSHGNIKEVHTMLAFPWRRGKIKGTIRPGEALSVVGDE